MWPCALGPAASCPSPAMVDLSMFVEPTAVERKFQVQLLSVFLVYNQSIPVQPGAAALNTQGFFYTKSVTVTLLVASSAPGPKLAVYFPFLSLYNSKSGN